MKQHLELYSFGNYECAKTLCKILSQSDKKLRKKTNQIIQRFIFEIKQLEYLTDSSIQSRLLYRSREYYLNRLNQYPFSKEIKDFAIATIITLYKEKLRKLKNERKIIIQEYCTHD